ncbi:hypothetical protein V5799_017576 [Amblyomma americanum]|uniref:Nose resistant-to-fluoxetine protein N-terminal domain-containing protein n=1 Tax=Amblyomma americanum TaxID=6943 RepID=A0AAQ4F1R2_AMBAM
MCSLLSTRRGWCGFASVMRAVFVTVLLTFPVVFAELYAAENATVAAFKGEKTAELVPTEMTPASAQHGDSVDYAKAFRDATACVMASIPASIQKKLLGAEISPQCSVALLRTMRAFQNFEPWALRLLDATGKYPTGLLQGSRSDPGAFDECIETVVRDSYGNDVSRGQYCNLVFYANNGTAIEKLMEPTLDFMHPIVRLHAARGRRKRLALGAFVLLSLVSYCLAAWTLARNPHIQPFLIIPGATPQGTLETVNKYYQLPFFHGMCYFSGCITCLIMDSFRQRKISKSVELAGWCVTGSSMLCCVFMKFAWYTSPNPTSEVGTQLAAFADRFLWSASLAWITLACATGRGGVFGRFLSRDVFVPLSKLSFGVYIIHLPFIELMLFASRERVFWSHFNQISLFFSVTVWSLLLSYISYVACEAPTGALDRLAFRRFRANGSEPKNEYTLENGVDVESCKKKEDATLARF